MHEVDREVAFEIRGALAPIANGLEILRLSASDDSASENVIDMMQRQMDRLIDLLNTRGSADGCRLASTELPDDVPHQTYS